MSRATGMSRGQLELLDHRVDDPHVGLVGDEGVEVVGADAGGVERLLGDLGHAPDRPAEDRLARPCRSPASARRPARLARARRTQASRLADGVALRAVGAPDRRADAGVSDGPTTAAPAPSPRMNAMPRSVGSVKSRELLDADDEDVARPSRRGPWRWPGRCRSSSRRRRRRCRTPRRWMPSRSASIGRRGGGLVRVGDGGDDDGADLRRPRARRRRGPRGRRPRTCRRRSRRRRRSGG